MTKLLTFAAALTVSIVLGSYLVRAQNPPATPPPPMSFFITSVGGGKGD